MNTIKIDSPLVSVTWLQKNINATNLVILDASIPKVTDNVSKEKTILQIPNSRFFDLKNAFSDSSAPFPITFPSLEQFQREAQKLGIYNESAIVVYDDKGIYSSPRAWWLFKAFGHNNIAVLDGGLPAWENAGFLVSERKPFIGSLGDFKPHYFPKYMKYFEDIKKESRKVNHIIIDARSEARFKSLEPEPRKGLRSGKIPNSTNIPFETIVENNHLKSIENIQKVFHSINKNSNITFSCGSGITACVLALGATLAGYKNISVYDGSWTEWGSLTTE